MASKSFELRELFHLTLLRHLGTRLAGRSYSVKGGICLRLFHRSPRLSEDIDLDIVSSMRVETLKNAVDSVIGSNALLASLVGSGVTRIRSSRTKQTETTQRWKVQLELPGETSLPTKVEFSRRADSLVYSKGTVDGELLRRYKTPQFVAQYYPVDSMAVQKIAALAAPARHALRDLFDLHHLLFASKADREAVAAALSQVAIERAIGKLETFGFEAFEQQVVPYLTAEMIAGYEDSTLFDRQKEDVEQALAGMLE